MIVSVNVADVGTARAMLLLAHPPRPRSTAGLLHADVGAASPLRRSNVPHPQPGRVGLIGFWETDDDVERFAASHPFARAMAGGWQVRLRPIRGWGTWPGLPPGVPRSRAVTSAGPVVVLTLARTRMTGLRRFLAANLPAERLVCRSPGFVWATALVRPPFFASCSLWESADAAVDFAYGHHESVHLDAIGADRIRPFHHREAFVRFLPLTSHGGLGGKNPLPAEWMTVRQASI
jgi:heme-degrading monooxygenase HmoA